MSTQVYPELLMGYSYFYTDIYSTGVHADYQTLKKGGGVIYVSPFICQYAYYSIKYHCVYNSNSIWINWVGDIKTNYC